MMRRRWYVRSITCIGIAPSNVLVMPEVIVHEVRSREASDACPSANTLVGSTYHLVGPCHPSLSQYARHLLECCISRSVLVLHRTLFVVALRLRFRPKWKEVGLAFFCSLWRIFDRRCLQVKLEQAYQ